MGCGRDKGLRLVLSAVYELPASVRLALWLTHAIRYARPFEDALDDALPDLDHVEGGLDRLELWRDLGEQVVCVDLPRPGVHGGLLPPGSAATSAAQEVGECLFVPSLGGVLVPRLEYYGPAGDEGLMLTLEPHDSEPVARHRLDALSLPDIDRRFREALLRDVATLETLDVAPFLGAGGRGRVDERIAGAEWALPPGIPTRALRIITTAGLVVAALDEAQSIAGGSLDATTSRTRDMTLTRLLGEAELALAEAATVAALDLAGLR